VKADGLSGWQKDVNCTFGILKGRWRILKSEVHLKSAIGIDCVWFTCCALHNWYLEADGLEEWWESGVSRDWEGELGKHQEGDVPNAIHNLTYDMLGMLFGNDVDVNLRIDVFDKRGETLSQDLTVHFSFTEPKLFLATAG
jgi:hypothetical protein